MFDPKVFFDNLQVYNPSKGRYEKDGIKIPSVTELLSYIDSEGLINWANAIGRQGMDNQSILRTAAQYGTNTHSAIEKFLNDKTDDMFISTSAFEAFKLWWYKLTENNKVEILGQEEPLVCDYFAGTYDLLLSINDKPYLIDFKTSNHVGYKYFMQLAAYRYLLYKLKGINIQGCVVLKLNKGPRPKFHEFTLNFDDPIHYNYIENSFMAFTGVVYTWHNAKACEATFKELFC